MIKRVKGRRSTVLLSNDYFPKIVEEQPNGWSLIETEGELLAYPDSQILYEPIESGFGGYNRSMIVRVNSSRPGRVFTISQGVIDVSWEDESIEMGDEEFTFGG